MAIAPSISDQAETPNVRNSSQTGNPRIGADDRAPRLLADFRAARSIKVGVSDMRVSKDRDAVLITHSLGSCIAVTVVDLTAGVAGLLHYQLPDSAADVARSKRSPLMYADTGLAMMLDEIEHQGGCRSRLHVNIAGGASMLGVANGFDIGRRNHAGIRKALWKQGLFLEAEDCGGHDPRTLSLRVRDGAVLIRNANHIYGLGPAAERALHQVGQAPSTGGVS
ncbi:MAG: chemotaxis protein CheD [Planctomycetota bacterium]